MKYKIVLILLIGLGLFLRGYRPDQNPVSLYWDEAAMAYDAYSLATTGQDMRGQTWRQAMFLSYGDFKLPLYIWLATISMKLLGPGVVAFKLVSIVAGTALIGVVYWLGKQVYRSEVAGLTAAGAVAISPWGIQFSRAGFEANVAVLLVGVFLGCMVMGLKRPGWWLAAAVSGALAVYGYFSVRFVVPMLAAWFVLIYIRKLTVRHGYYLLFAGLVFVGMLLPIYRSDKYAASNQFRLSTPSLLNTNEQVLEQNLNREWAGNGPVSRLAYHRVWFLVERLAERVSNHMSGDFLFIHGDANLRHGTGMAGLFLIGMLPLFAVGWWALVQRERKWGWFLLGGWAITLIPAAVPLEGPHALRSLNALPLLAMVMAAGGWYGGDVIHKKQPWLTYLAAGFLWLNLLTFWHAYWDHYPSRSHSWWQYPYEQLARAIAAYEDDYQHVLVTELDRFYLYYLYFNRVDPKQTPQLFEAMAAGKPARIGTVQFGGFEPDALPEEKEILVVLTQEQYQERADIFREVASIPGYDGTVVYRLVTPKQTGGDKR